MASGKTCMNCLKKIRTNVEAHYYEAKALMADERLDALKLAMEKYSSQGCCCNCPIDTDAWVQHCEGCNDKGGSGPIETLTKQKQSLSTDWDHNDPNKKNCNCNKQLNRKKRVKEIEGPPGCTIRHMSCYR